MNVVRTEPIVQILTELTRGLQTLKVLIGGNDHSGIGALGHVRSQRKEFTVLQKA
jgi:hypothetical protein